MSARTLLTTLLVVGIATLGWPVATLVHAPAAQDPARTDVLRTARPACAVRVGPPAPAPVAPGPLRPRAAADEAAPETAPADPLHDVEDLARRVEELQAELDVANALLHEQDLRLRWRESLWQARLDRQQLEADLRAWVERDHPALVTADDPNEDDTLAVQVTDILLDVADLLAPEEDEEPPQDRTLPPFGLADLQATLGLGVVARLAASLSRMNLACSFAPGSRTACVTTNGVTRIVATVPVASVDNDKVHVRWMPVTPDDPRMALADRDHHVAEVAWMRELNAILGLDLYDLE
jgi:hypothetical protein